MNADDLREVGAFLDSFSLTLVDQPYYSLGWFRLCARAIVVLELRRAIFASAAEVADALIKRTTELQSGGAKGMTAFFMPEEALSDDDILHDVRFDKTIGYWEMIAEEKRMKMPQTIHPVDLVMFCQLLHIPYLSEKQPEEAPSAETRPTPARKRGRGKANAS